MERRTVLEPLEGRYRLHIQFGGRPYWCMFDYVVSPQVDDGVEIVLAATAPDAVSSHWFPHIRKGMIRGLAEAEERGRRLVGVRIEVQKVFQHDVDTTEQGCERYGSSFMTSLIWDRSAPVPESRHDITTEL